jgi:lysophospholipase L1-like esterase
MTVRTPWQAICCGLLFASLAAASQAGTPVFRFDFGPGKVASGYVQVPASAVYSRETGYGFEPGTQVSGIDRGGDDPLRADFVTSDKPFFFSVQVPEGNYRVTVTLGDASGPSDTTIKAELRRLMLEKVTTEPGKFKTCTFVVNVRTPAIAGGGQVRLKDREKNLEALAWDEKLTVEFNGLQPRVCSMEIARADDLPTLFILGDSTVCDQPSEPWNSWGQMLTRFFRPDIAVANHAESGESIRSSLGAARFDKVYSLLKKGDTLLVQFGHNDMKDRDPNALAVYTANLRKIVAEVRRRGATPVLLTSMERKAGVEKDTLAGYPDAVRQVAREEHAALIDLHAKSKVLYRALGQNLDKAFQDGTHHNNYGSYEFAQCVIQGIRDSQPDLARHVVEDFKGFDPARPDPVDQFQMPASPGVPGQTPLGS